MRREAPLALVPLLPGVSAAPTPGRRREEGWLELELAWLEPLVPL